MRIFADRRKMSRLNKDMDHAGMNALSKAKMFAIEKNWPEVTPEMVAYSVLVTGPNVVTDAISGMGFDSGKIATKILSKIQSSMEGQIYLFTRANSKMAFIPKNSNEIQEMGKKAKDIKDSMRHTRLGSHHLLLATIGVSPAVRDVFVQEGIHFDSLAESISQATKDMVGPESFFAAKKSPKASNSTNQHIQSEPVGVLKKGLAPKKIGDVLSKYAVDLTAKAQAGKLSPVIGREFEISRAFTVLCRKIKNNVLLVGEHGVGKTAIVEGLAQKIADGKAPEKLQNKKIFMIDMASIVAGTQYRGQFEERLKSVMEAFEQSEGEYIAFIDEIHTLLGAGSAVGTMDAANILKPALARGVFKCIGATTEDEYKKFFKKDGALDRRFQSVFVDEPTREETISILKGLRPGLEVFHDCTVSDEAVHAAVEYADLHLAGRHFPDKAIDILDEMCSTYADHEGPLSKAHAANVTSVLTQIPLDIIMHSEYERVAKVEETMSEKIFGQDRAVRAVSQSLKRAYSGLRDPRRPLASLLFSGPTGVGKTYVAEQLAKAVFGSEDALVKLNMTEFSEKHTVTRLIGSPPSYVGYGERNQFADKILRRPHCLVLLDEIEKAHEDVVKVFMDVLLNGIITDAEGRKISFRNAILIMTTNIGFAEGYSTSSLGFVSKNSSSEYEANKDRIVSLCSKQFGPEFSNRVDEIVLFSPLEDFDLCKVASETIKELSQRMESIGTKLKYEETLFSQIVRCSKEEHGQNASRIRRFIRNKIEPSVSEAIMKNENGGKSVKLSISEDGTIEVTSDKKTK